MLSLPEADKGGMKVQKRKGKSVSRRRGSWAIEKQLSSLPSALSPPGSPVPSSSARLGPPTRPLSCLPATARPVRSLTLPPVSDALRCAPAVGADGRFAKRSHSSPTLNKQWRTLSIRL